MARKFTRNGREYSDAPAGWLNAQKDHQNDKLTEAGHNITWERSAPGAFTGTCQRCTGAVVVAAASTYVDQPNIAGQDIRHAACPR